MFVCVKYVKQIHILLTKLLMYINILLWVIHKHTII